MAELSKRLQAVADLVTPGMRLADVGTDHAYIPIYLTQNGLVPSAIAMDINKGPLERADTHILEHGLDGKIVTRLSDGLVNLKMEEADTMIAAGMGGGLVIHILNEDLAKTRSLKELILQPQSELAKVRRYLEEHRFRIVAEDMVEEDGKYYPMMKVIPTEQKGLYAEGVPAAEEELEYGKYLLEKGHPVMGEIEARFPKHYAMEWDNVGLQVGRSDKEVKRIYLALDATDEVIEEAADWGADMLITHHPMIFKAMKKINDEDFIGRRVLKLIRDDISYYAMHTNYDVMGMAELAGKVLELSEPEVLEVTGSMHSESGEVPVGIGRVADLAQPMDLKSCAEMVKKAFDLPNVKIFGEPDMQVHRLGVFPGSGKSAISVSLEKGVDVLVTGDIDHHEGIDAVAQKMAVIDAGHYGVEHIFIADMEHFCREKFPEAEIRTAKIRQPFWVLT